MTKSTITREQLEEWVAQFDEDGGCDATDRQLEALIRQSLAAMDSEPVAWRRFQETPTDGGYWILYDYKPNCSEVEPLYRHAQPAPVVPELRVDWQENEFSAGWNACRAAMLAAAPQSPGSEPATVPGKWIPVSERMPERGDYLVTDGCDFDVQLFNGEQFIPGFVWEDKITHWMPLPAAPQGVIHG
ncbi:TPA: DUF551 domain-containing protein [Klebsiella pneumoniae]